MSLNLLTDEQIATMVQLQHEANSVMSEDWLTSDNNSIWYYRAGWMELAECAGHIGIKWWKDEHPTEEAKLKAKEQATMELVDYMHFAISDTTRRYAIDNSITEVTPEFCLQVASSISRKMSKALPIDNKKDLLKRIEQFIYTIIRDRYAHWSIAVTMSEYMGLDGQYLLEVYLAKNILNKFRTKHGQRTGEYHKIWNGEEDNVYLTSILKHRLDNDLPIEIDAIQAELFAIYDSLRAEGLTQFQ